MQWYHKEPLRIILVSLKKIIIRDFFIYWHVSWGLWIRETTKFAFTGINSSLGKMDPNKTRNWLRISWLVLWIILLFGLDGFGFLLRNLLNILTPSMCSIFRSAFFNTALGRRREPDSNLVDSINLEVCLLPSNPAVRR